MNLNVALFAVYALSEVFLFVVYGLLRGRLLASTATNPPTDFPISTSYWWFNLASAINMLAATAVAIRMLYLFHAYLVAGYYSNLTMAILGVVLVVQTLAIRRSINYAGNFYLRGVTFNDGFPMVLAIVCAMVSMTVGYNLASIPANVPRLTRGLHIA